MPLRKPEGSVFIVVMLLLAGTGLAGANELVPQPFRATYSVQWRGMTAGTSTLELEKTGPDSFTYRSRNVARGIFRLALPDAVTQESEFSIVDGVVSPMSYRADDGSSDTKHDVTLKFDWDAGRVTGVAEDQPVDEPLKPGTQDSLSVQIALMRALAAGETPSSFALIDKNEVKTYQYTFEGRETLDTEIGQFDTVIYQSQREGSTRLTRLWLAPDLGFLPLRAQQLRKGKPEFTMQIRSLERTPVTQAQVFGSVTPR